MTLSLKNVVRWFIYGPRRNGYSGSLVQRDHVVLPTESHRTARTVLFVDDEPSILKIRRLVFEALGYSVLTATCGEEALQAIELYSVDAVVLDYLTPGMDGEEIARCIRRLRDDIPIILSSGCLTVPTRVLEVVTAAVEKGRGPEALIEALEQHLYPLLNPTPNRDSEACAD
jgi:CheY-like chemotaxis protein